MIQKFHRYEEASFFVEEKLAEGYHAYITNEAVGFLWGPRTVGGFRVYVSDEPMPESANQSEPAEFDDPVSRFIRFIVLSIVGIGLVAGTFFVLAALPAVLKLLATLAVVILGGYFIFNRDSTTPRP